MPDDAKIFGEAYELYERWRVTDISTPEQWMRITNEFHEFACRHPGNRLAMRLAVSLMDTFDDMYRNGKKPDMPDYFGRSDL